MKSAKLEITDSGIKVSLEGSGVVRSIKKLAPLLRKKSIRAETLPGYETIDVLGVSNQLGITKTNHKKSKDLSKYQLIEENDFAYNPYRINVGSIGLVQNGARGLVSPAYVVFSTTKDLLPELLLDFLKSTEGLYQISQYARGTVRKALRFEDLCQIEMLVPSVEKQREILKKKDRVQPNIKNLESEIAHQQILLKKLRQTILQEAIEGKLTADWRKKNPNVEPANELLSRIQTEKEQLIKDKKIKKQKPLPPIDASLFPFVIPKIWEWTSVGEITNVITSGSRNWKSLYSKSGCSFIRSQDIKLDRLQYANRVYVNVSKGAEGTRTSVNKGDWLITITGGNVGKCAYLNDDPGEAYVSQHVGLMRPTKNEIGHFGHLWLIAEYGGRGLLSNFIYGDKPGLNLPQLRNLLIPLPPLKEQKVIVTKVKKLLVVCDQLEQQITTNQTHTEHLMQAVLKEAFQQSEVT